MPRTPLSFDSFPVRDQPVRFAAGDPSGLTSNSWRIWRERQGDLYIACRDNYRQMKVSLHKSGSWQIGLTAEAVRADPRLLLGSGSRHWEVWRRPDPAMPGATVAFRLTFLPTEFGLSESLRPPSKWRDVAYLYSDGTGWHVFTLWITDGEPSLGHESSPSTTLAIYPLPNGEAAQLTFHVEPVTEEAARDLAAAYRAAYDMAMEVRVDPPSGARLLLFGSDQQGARRLIEMWWHRGPDGAPLLPPDLDEA